MAASHHIPCHLSCLSSRLRQLSFRAFIWANHPMTNVLYRTQLICGQIISSLKNKRCMSHTVAWDTHRLGSWCRPGVPSASLLLHLANPHKFLRVTRSFLSLHLCECNENRYCESSSSVPGLLSSSWLTVKAEAIYVTNSILGVISLYSNMSKLPCTMPINNI